MMSSLNQTDQGFMERYDAFVEQQIASVPGLRLDEETRDIAVLAALLGCQGIAYYKEILTAALKRGMNPVVVKEIVYQATAYLGMGRVYPFLETTNQVMSDYGVALPLKDQVTTTRENWREKGTQAQVDIFGGGMREFWKSGHINRLLAANCFGDYYTRTGLNLKQRELITFCFLAAQGGEQQLVSHVKGNMNVGNDKESAASGNIRLFAVYRLPPQSEHDCLYR